MSMRAAKVCCLLLTLLASAVPAADHAADQGAAAKPITLGECVRRALHNGFDLALERYNVDLARESIVDAHSRFDPRLSTSVISSVTRAAGGTTTADTRSESVAARAGVSQLLGLGTELVLGSNLGRSEFAPSTTPFDAAYAADVTLGIRQPLLRGWGTTVNTAPIRRAEIGLASAERSYESRALDVIQGTEIAYYALSGARDQLLVFETSVDLARQLLDEATARNKAGMATKLDVLQAEVGMANAQRALFDARKVVEDSQDALLSFLGRFELDEALGPTSVQEVARTDLPSVQASFSAALEHQPEYANARAAIELAQLDTTLARDSLKPALDLELAYGLSGEQGSGRGAFSEAFTGDRNAWQAGLLLTYPLGRRGEKARYRQSLSRLERQELQLEQLEQDILLAVRSAVRDIETSFESVNLAAQAAELANRQHDAEVTRFKAGLSTSRRVLEAQADLQSARVAHLQAKLNLSVALARLTRVEGTGLDRYAVSLP